LYKLVIDSGASKSDWVFFNQEKSFSANALGVNPISNSNTSNLIHPIAEVSSDGVSEIYFYGAGLIGEDMKNKVLQQLKSIYPEASRIEIASDLLGAARATSDGKISIVSILGTGANSSLFDGKELKPSIPSLGYIFGDEGSGFSIGKEVIKSFFYGYMPEHDRDKFIQKYGQELGPILGDIYSSNRPNYKVAKFAAFLNDTEPEYKNYILERVFNDFIEQRITRIKKTADFPLNFVGSIAYHFQDILKTVCKLNGYEVDQILEKPIDQLKIFHQNNG